MFRNYDSEELIIIDHISQLFGDATSDVVVSIHRKSGRGIMALGGTCRVSMGSFICLPEVRHVYALCDRAISEGSSIIAKVKQIHREGYDKSCGLSKQAFRIDMTVEVDERYYAPL